MPVTQDEAYDVAIDMRKNSPSYGKHVGVILSAENKRQPWVADGFAHGFYVLSETAEFIYKCTDYYTPAYEQSVRWNEPELSTPWPITANTAPCLSSKDRDGLSFKPAPTLR